MKTNHAHGVGADPEQRVTGIPAEVGGGVPELDPRKQCLVLFINFKLEVYPSVSLYANTEDVAVVALLLEEGIVH